MLRGLLAHAIPSGAPEPDEFFHRWIQMDLELVKSGLQKQPEQEVKPIHVGPAELDETELLSNVHSTSGVIPEDGPATTCPSDHRDV